jgi:hypothetical protein
LKWLTDLLPSVPEIRVLIARILLPPRLQTPFIFAWSLWRRKHQAAAALKHHKRNYAINTQL